MRTAKCLLVSLIYKCDESTNGCCGLDTQVGIYNEYSLENNWLSGKPTKIILVVLTKQIYLHIGSLVSCRLTIFIEKIGFSFRLFFL